MPFLNLFSKLKIIKEILRHERCADYVMTCLGPNLVKTSSLPFADIRSKLKIFSGVADKNPLEQVARVNKALLREVVVDAVKQMVFRQNLPYIHLSHYPGGYRTLCAFRIDCDECDRGSFFNLLQHAQKHELSMTWFIDVSAQEDYLEEVASIQNAGHDIQLHCYHHQTYRNRQDNERNLKKGKELLEAVGVPVRGFAAPFGQWNPWLNQALENLNFSYSSEFAIGYDDIPFYPFLGRRFSRVLQIPIHPICLGSLVKAGCSPHEMKCYFERIIGLKYRRGNPILLYGHPKNEMDRFPEIVDFIFSMLKDLQDVWVTTYMEYANWWQRRLMANFEVNIEGDCLSVKTDNSDPALQLRIERPDFMETYIPLRTDRRPLAELTWSRKEIHPAEPTTEIGHISSNNFKNFAGRLCSYARNTRQRISDLLRGI